MIEINKKWALGADSFNIILYRKTKPKEKGRELTKREQKYLKEKVVRLGKAFGYYATLHQSLTALVNQEVRDTKLTSLKALTAKLDETYALINTLPQIAVADLKKKREAIKANA